MQYKQGDIVLGTVSGIQPYGAFIKLDNSEQGLIHISEISYSYVKNITDFVNVGDLIYAEVIDIDESLGQLKLSIKNIDYRYNRGVRKHRIIETESGFNTLASMLPIWIEENLKKMAKSVDK